jgi:hypothetical protein
VPQKPGKYGPKGRNAEVEVVLKGRQCAEPLFSTNKLEQPDKAVSLPIGKSSNIKDEKSRSSDDVMYLNSSSKLQSSDSGTQVMSMIMDGSGLIMADRRENTLSSKKSDSGKIRKTVEVTMVKLPDSARKSKTLLEVKSTTKGILNNTKSIARGDFGQFSAPKMQDDSSTNNVRAA